MKKFASALSLVCLVTASPALAALRVTEVASTSGAPAGVLQDRDWWEFTNTGPAAVLLDGYAWEDNPIENIRSGFPAGVTIGVGESIIIHQGTDPAIPAAFRTTWGLAPTVQVLTEDQFLGTNKFSGLGSSGDGVNVFDAVPSPVAGVSFGPSTSGVTFEWDGQGNTLGLSVNGENGAHLSSYGGIGSPGVAVLVPEPTTLALIASALVAFRGGVAASHAATRRQS